MQAVLPLTLAAGPIRLVPLALVRVLGLLLHICTVEHIVMTVPHVNPVKFLC